MQTTRPTADLLSLYADNSSGAISPEDLRDLIASWASYGTLIGAQKTTAVTLTTDWQTLLHWTTAGPSSEDITLSTSGASITVSVAGWYLIGCTTEFGPVASRSLVQNQVYTIQIGDADNNKVGGIAREAKSNYAGTYTASMGSAGMMGVAYLAAGTVLSVQGKLAQSESETTGNMHGGQFFVVRIA